MVMDRGPQTNDCLNAQSYSIDFVFNRNSVANIVIRLIREFNLEKGTNKEPRGLLANRPEMMYQLVVALQVVAHFVLIHFSPDKSTSFFYQLT